MDSTGLFHQSRSPYDPDLFQIHDPYPYPRCTERRSQQWHGVPDDLLQFRPHGKRRLLFRSNKIWYALGVIIHEVGHNFFPMIINSDERQWSWMDEGLNSFVEYLTEELGTTNSRFAEKAGLYHCRLHETPERSAGAHHVQFRKHHRIWPQCLYQARNRPQHPR